MPVWHLKLSGGAYERALTNLRGKLMRLREEFLAQHEGDRVAAAGAFAEALMEGEPEVFKAGYTAPNALIAATEVFALDESEREAVAQLIGGEDGEPDS